MASVHPCQLFIRLHPYAVITSPSPTGRGAKYCDLSVCPSSVKNHIPNLMTTFSVHGPPMFCSLGILDPRVGHTMDVLSPFISVLCHSDWLFHGESCHVLMLSIQTVRGVPRLLAPDIVPCIISFFRQLPYFLMVWPQSASFLVLTVCNSSLFTPALSFYDNTAIRYVLPFLWMTSCFHLMGPAEQNQRQRYVLLSSPGGSTGGWSCCLQLQACFKMEFWNFQNFVMLTIFGHTRRYMNHDSTCDIEIWGVVRLTDNTWGLLQSDLHVALNTVLLTRGPLAYGWLRGTVMERRSFAAELSVLRLTCNRWVTTYVAKPSTTSPPTRPTQPLIFFGFDKWVVSCSQISATSVGGGAIWWMLTE